MKIATMAVEVAIFLKFSSLNIVILIGAVNTQGDDAKQRHKILSLDNLQKFNGKSILINA